MSEEQKIVGIIDTIPLNPDILEYATVEELEGKTFYFQTSLRVNLHIIDNPAGKVDAEQSSVRNIIHLSIEKFKMFSLGKYGEEIRQYEFEGVDLSLLKPEDKVLFDKYAKDIKESYLGKDFVDCKFDIDNVDALFISVEHVCSKNDRHGNGMKVTYETRN